MKKLTFDDKMATILAMIRRWQPPPSIDEMVKAASVKSKDTIHNRLRWLEDNGYIHTNPGTRRTYVATEKGINTFPELVVLRGKHNRGGTERK
jgi:SOS-response transcriptional repressor LexA